MVAVLMAVQIENLCGSLQYAAVASLLSLLESTKMQRIASCYKPENAPVNRRVVGSSPTSGAIYTKTLLGSMKLKAAKLAAIFILCRQLFRSRELLVMTPSRLRLPCAPALPLVTPRGAPGDVVAGLHALVARRDFGSPEGRIADHRAQRLPARLCNSV